MKKLILIQLVLLIWFPFFSCTDNDQGPKLVWDDSKVLIDQKAFDAAITDDLKINSLDIEGDFLTINISSGGCNGESWEIRLIDSGEVLESDPPQRNLVLFFKNEELCEAYITKEVAFDIADLKVEGDQVLLNIRNTGQQILYEY
ncbi:hypothetical protein JYB62_15425 [Algoriphagus lutimaris]|uniref:hypothetical protein n=1 Tax=Algoriphagus lutimaris TaxID=613197 RepID=UPI00196B350A|nr:hypothetical protein [Algoriphagus lutimaris]MBN3521400.1 hypothetical protein [Algoriphagus lutimaris]